MAQLTKRFIDEIVPDPSRDVYYWDATLPGFGLRVKPSGRMVYILTYRNKHRRSRWMTIGQHGTIAPDQARKKATQLLAQAQMGDTDPADERDQVKGSMTMKQLAERYMKDHAKIRKKPQSIYNDQRFIDKFIIPQMGARKVQEFTRQDIAKFHTSLSDTPYQANRVLTLLSTMFNLSEIWGERPDGSNPCRRVSRFPEKACERYLSPEELKRIGKTLKEIEDEKSEPQVAIDALRLLILTGARKSEILNLKWSEVDLKSGLLRLEDSKTGSKVIYLNLAAIDILKKIKRDPVWVIPSERRDDKPFNGLYKIWERVREKAQVPDLRIHDLRHSFASVAAGLGEGLLIIGKLLGHTQASTTQRYAHLADNPIRTANERIGQVIEQALNSDGAKVIDLHHAQEAKASSGSL
ncbi:MAG: site-specific integrase [Candidatus Sumerlaeia bacterium]